MLCCHHSLSTILSACVQRWTGEKILRSCTGRGWAPNFHDSSSSKACVDTLSPSSATLTRLQQQRCSSTTSQQLPTTRHGVSICKRKVRTSWFALLLHAYRFNHAAVRIGVVWFNKYVRVVHANFWVRHDLCSGTSHEIAYLFNTNHAKVHLWGRCKQLGSTTTKVDPFP